ncbi:MAG: threonine synthase [Candidatus Micrarchaeia archaeon]
MPYWLECIACRRRYEAGDIVYACTECGDLLDIRYEHKRPPRIRERIPGVWRYGDFLPFDDPKHIISLGEGDTGLYACPSLSSELGLSRPLYVKNEGENPTGSFKDRGMTVGITKARALGAKCVGCASTGNTSASLAAYAARGGLRCIVFVPAGKIAMGKLAQALVYGAEVFALEGNFDDAMRAVLELSAQGKIYLLNSINPYRGEGQKTIAFEIAEQLDFNLPEYIFVPVGNAANISAIWKGFKEFREAGLIEALPKMVGVQAEGAAPLARLFASGSDDFRPEPNPRTVASAIQIGNPVSWKKAIRAARESRGRIIAVSDEEILRAQSLLASREGIFVEPASAASIAGVKKLREKGELSEDASVACVCTGNGLKDPDAVIGRYQGAIKRIKNLKEARL